MAQTNIILDQLISILKYARPHYHNSEHNKYNKFKICTSTN